MAAISETYLASLNPVVQTVDFKPLAGKQNLDSLAFKSVLSRCERFMTWLASFIPCLHGWVQIKIFDTTDQKLKDIFISKYFQKSLKDFAVKPNEDDEYLITELKKQKKELLERIDVYRSALIQNCEMGKALQAWPHLLESQHREIASIDEQIRLLRKLPST